MNNPQAFPQCAYNLKGGYDIIGGMTLRDYFAAKAMQGLLAADTGFTMYSAQIAEISYAQADAMMKAREA